MRCHLFLAAIVAAGSACALGQALPQSSTFPIERFYKYPLLNGRSPSAAAMSPDGSKIVYGWNQTGERKLNLWVMDYPSGKAKMIVQADKIENQPIQDDTRTDQQKKDAILYDGGIGGATWSQDGKELEFDYKGRSWTVNPDGSDLHAVFDGGLTFAGADYSPDGKFIAFNDGPNLFRYDRSNGYIKQLTFLNKPKQEISGHQWSPDSQQIAVSWQDSSKTGTYQMMDYTKERATVVNIQRDWNGDLSQDNQVGIISKDGGLVRFAPDIPRYSWILDWKWSPDGKNLSVGWLKDDFKEYTLSLIDATKNTKSDVYHEVAPKNYIPDWRPHVWTRDSKHILFGTDIIDNKFGFRSVMQIDPNGKNLTKFFAENYDVVAMGRPKNSDRIILDTMSRSPLTDEITIVEPDGKRTQHIVMPNGFSTGKNFDDAALPLFSEDGKMIATMASDRTINPELYAVEPKMERLTKSQLPEFAKIKWADYKEVTFTAPDGVTVHGVLITKPGLDMTKKHPAFISNIYANSGKMAWGGYLENYAAMELDMVVLCVDFRSSWGMGGELNSGYYQKMGLVDADEAVSAKNFLAALPYVRSDRVGIWGWSYGGYLTCMTLLTKPGVFDTGVAVAPVTDWTTYNEWYTRRRLGLAKDNKDIFAKTSPITYASGLKDNLLLVHGILDDNVLFQDTAHLIQGFIDNGKYFDEMTYPKDDHSIGKDTSRPHVFGTIMRYLYDKLNRD